ncbi:MAG: LysM peptidoglycan-binding domain-containing protein [Coprococcus sp.]|nr:LysM peptidoglycan-binding domain-containing protein [Coprococcus sp.]
MNKIVRFISDKKITIIVSIIVLAIAYVAVFQKDASEADATHSSTKYYTCIEINSGDSLWSIAETYMTDEYSSTQEYIDEVVSINHLNHASSIEAGTNLLVPYYKVNAMN